MRVELASIFASAQLAAGWAQESPALVGAWRSTLQAPADAVEFLRGAGWLPAGRGSFTEMITLADDGRSFASTLRYEPFDAKGRRADGGGTAKGQAVRAGF